MSLVEMCKNRDMTLLLIKYQELHLKELTYYGTSDISKLFNLININNELIRIEKIINEEYYKKFVNIFLNNTKQNMNLYNLQKILFESFDTILLMSMLYISNMKESTEFDLKTKCLADSIQNFVKNFLNPVSSKIKFIILTNKNFKISFELTYLKKFLILKKNIFLNKEIIQNLETFIKLFE